MKRSYEDAVATKMAYANWISEMKWKYFISVRRPNKLTKNSINTLYGKIEKEKEKENRDFPNKLLIVAEADADPTNHHLHLLLDCDQQQRDVFLNKVFGKSTIKYAEEIEDIKSTAIYITKMFHKDNTSYNFF